MRVKAITLKSDHRNPCLAEALVLLSAILAWNIVMAQGFVVQETGRTFIVDRTGERWDATQAQRLGFDPNAFQYGIGKHVFQPLDDQALGEATGAVRATRIPLS